MLGRYRLLPGLLFIATAPAIGPAGVAAVPPLFATQHAGYRISTEFTIDPERHSVVSPPAGARTGDLLWIRPLRLNGDEYLVLQKCDSADCSGAKVIRAWNAFGAMGPLPILSNKIRMQAGAKYMIWMQRIVVKGGDTFPQFKSDSAPLAFTPTGPAKLFEAADLEGAKERGPTPIANANQEGGAFVARFEGGSVVRMQMLRAQSDTSAH